MSTSLGMVLGLGSASLSPAPIVTRLSIPVISWTLLVSTALAAHTLPYVPTTILLAESNTVPLRQNVTADVAYIFSPRDDTVDLLALNISADVRASSISLE
jgi:hypothetical protein